MKYYIIAGERSGDLHGGNLVKEILRIDRNAQIRAWGGEEMELAGATIVKHYRELAFMGFWEVLVNIRTIRKNLNDCKHDILDWNPDTVVLIDYPGFNMRIAKFVKNYGIKVCYYISPKIWAWNTKRAHKIKKFVDRMFCILPFEKEFYKEFSYDVVYVGNPLQDSIHNYSVDIDFTDSYPDEKILAVLPGSRKQELLNIVDSVAGLINAYPEIKFLVAGVSNLDRKLYHPLERFNNVEIIFDKSYDILNVADGAIVTSGTATLETALFNVPQVVCYRTSALTYSIAKHLIKVDYISLVNLIAGKEVVKELIQDQLTVENLRLFVEDVIQNSENIVNILDGYKQVKENLGTKKASQTTAKLIYDFVSLNS